MKTLYLIRHAKSSWSFNQLDDFNRPLGPRGRKDVIKIGKYISKNISSPDLMITSTASRAFYTSLFLADAWDYSEEDLILEPALYHADEEEILDTIREYGHDHSVIAVAGHNPGFTDIANELLKKYIENIPTCGIMGVSFDIDSWEEIGEKTGKQQFFIYPKGLK